MLLALDTDLATLFAPPRKGFLVFSWNETLGRQAKRTATKGAARTSTVNSSGPSAQDLDRFQALFLPHMDAAFRFARFLTRNDAAAEDVVQDAYVRALRAFSSFRGGDAKAWLFAIIRNRFLTRTRERTFAPESAAPLMRDERTPEAGLIARQDRERMRALIEALPEALREVLVMREIDDMAYREIAIAINAPIGTVMSRLARARAALADAWRSAEQTP